MSQRAIETLKSVDRILAEDTRQTLKLLSHFGIGGKPLDALHAHSPDRDVYRAAEALEKGATMALVTDAGTPSVSDPGESLVAKAIACGVTIVPIPGASAVLAALVASGLAGNGGFRFVGFLPRDGANRHAAIAKVCATAEPVILFESPERTAETLAELATAMPGRPCAVARELTKMHEEIVRGALTELAAPREWRGEIAIVLGAWQPEAREDEVTEAAIDARIDKELANGLHSKTIAERIAAWSGRPKREIYERVIARKNLRRDEE
ncbi:MAG: 16S rRNA (cytidine(1402)-2'-O)-methyltransferase [Labilithrix sp.]|nr:16S rRNA (cytidine(1402)-2'-O)-methyltransferase [Labilithrix sp.]MCW5818025.1 16S rRNA (cytidine(1402)-2'-O)-methyltransferase [Labilithrix sp.]